MKKALVSRKEIQGMNSGTSLLLFQQAQVLQDLGYEVYAIAEKIEGIEKSGYTPVKTLRWPFSGYFRRKFYAGRVSAWIKRNKPELVIGNGDIFEQGILCMHNCMHLAQELMHGNPLPKNDQTGRIHEEIFARKGFKMLVCNSALMQHDFVSRFNVPEEKTCVIYPSVDISQFSLENSTEASKEWCSKLGFSPNDLILGLITSGNFKKRNVELLVRTLFALKHEFPTLKALVVGKDKSEPYIKLAEELGVSADIIFAPPIKDVQCYHNMVDIFVLPAFIEEFGIVALEAMASAKPVILGKNIGAQEILEAHQRDFVLQELSVAEFTAKLKPLLVSAELRQSLGETNRQTAAKYSGEKLRASYRAVIKGLHP